jgi:hypothetical protein
VRKYVRNSFSINFLGEPKEAAMEEKGIVTDTSYCYSMRNILLREDYALSLWLNYLAMQPVYYMTNLD